MAIFDNIQDRVVIVTPVWPSADLAPRAAYDLARERLATSSPTSTAACPTAATGAAPARRRSRASNVTREQYHGMVARDVGGPLGGVPAPPQSLRWGRPRSKSATTSASRSRARRGRARREIG